LKTGSKPFFSVVVPCYNVGESVIPTLECLKNQSFTDFEVILVNDGSSDNTFKIITDFKMSQVMNIISQPNKGLGAARNTGIKKSKGEYIALFDADDIWDVSKLEKVYDFITANNVDVICHNEYVKNQDNEIITINSYGPYTTYQDLLFKNNCLSPSAVTFRREVIKKVGYFTEDLNLHGVEDYDMWLRMAKYGIKLNYMPDILGSYIIHGNNMSTNYIFFDKIEYLHIVHADEINLNNIATRFKYRYKLTKLYSAKTIQAFKNGMVLEVFRNIRDLLLLIFALDKYIQKKKNELGSL
jgi:glycosyltransferase involved in cell wall biosynthesis